MNNGISSNALEIQLITSLNRNLSLDAKLLSTIHSIFSADYHFVFVHAKIT